MFGAGSGLSCRWQPGVVQGPATQESYNSGDLRRTDSWKRVLWAWGMGAYPGNTAVGESVPSFPALDGRAGGAGGALLRSEAPARSLPL